jgi:hypothetical protein
VNTRRKFLSILGIGSAAAVTTQPVEAKEVTYKVVDLDFLKTLHGGTEATINKMAADGWEFVSLARGVNNTHTMVFRRVGAPVPPSETGDFDTYRFGNGIIRIPHRKAA